MSVPDKYIIRSTATVLEALAKLNTLSSDILTLLVIDREERLVGTITDGDIRRALIGGTSLTDNVLAVVHRDSFVLRKEDYTIDTVRTIRKKRLTLVPLLDEHNRIIKIFNFKDHKTFLPIDAVLMAGGRGERLRPLTDSVPKPLLPLGNKPIVEYNIDNLISYGIENLTVSVRYLGEQIQQYFGDGSQKGISISYIHENKPLGTIGAAGQIKSFKNDTVLVMNSDLFTNIDFEEFYFHFIESNADMSVACIPYNVSVPYAVMQTSNGLIRSFEEKPTYTYYSNGGIYLIKREVFAQFVKEGERYDATDLMQALIEADKRVTSFPIVGYWIDIGRLEDYKKAQEFIKYLKVD